MIKEGISRSWLHLDPLLVALGAESGHQPPTPSRGRRRRNEKIMKPPTLFFILIIPLIGISCSFPQRSKSILPPTNVRDLCRFDESYYYSTTFDFCFRYASPEWKIAKTSLPRDLAGTNITFIDFFLPDSNNESMQVLTLFITRPSEENLAILKEDNIIPVLNTEPYLIGYKQAVEFSLDESINPRLQEIPKMLKNIQVFATTPY